VTVAPAPAKEPIRPKADLAYVIQSVDGERIVKVGRSADPIHRVKGIRGNVPFDIGLVAMLADGAKREREMKSLLSDSKVKGEWFVPDDRLNSYLREAAAAKAIVTKVNVDEAFFTGHILPLVLEYLNGRDPLFNDPGDFVYRVIHAGYGAAKGRLGRLFKACPDTFTPELLAGYVPVPFDAMPPEIVIPSPAPSNTGEAA
jgi:hypothetical protein